MNNHSLADGEKIARNSLLNLVFLGGIKLVAGLVTGMTVIIADAISTFADTLGLFASYLGLKLSRRSADEKFEYGYYKIETFAAFIISLGIIFIGTNILMDSIETLRNPTEGHLRSFAITTTVISIVFSFRLAAILSAASVKYNSLALKASATDKRLDIFSGFGVLLSIIANYQNIPYVEGIVSITIALLIIKEGLVSAKESFFFLLDYWNDPKLTQNIRDVFKKEKGIVQSVKKIRLRRAGTFIFGEAFIDINPFAGMQDLRESLNILKEQITELSPYIKDFSIYSNIPQSKKTKVAIPLKKGRSLQGEVATNLNQTNTYLFVTIQNNKVKKTESISIKDKDKDPVSLASILKKQKTNILIDNGLSSLVYYNLRRTNHILIYPNFPDIKKAKDTIKLLLIDS